MEEKMSKQEAFALSVMDLLGTPTSSPTSSSNDLSLLISAEKKIQSDSARRNFVDIDAQSGDDVKKKKIRVDFIRTHLTPINEKIVDVDMSLSASMSGSNASLSKAKSHHALGALRSSGAKSPTKFAALCGVSNHIDAELLDCSAKIIGARVKEAMIDRDLPSSPPLNPRTLNRVLNRNAVKRSENYSSFAAKWKHSNSSVHSMSVKGDTDDMSEVSVTSISSKHGIKHNEYSRDHLSDDASDESDFPIMLKNRKNMQNGGVNSPGASSSRTVDSAGTKATLRSSSPSRNSNRSDLNKPQKSVEIDKLNQSIITYESIGNHGSYILSIENDENGEEVVVPRHEFTAKEITKRENQIRDSVGVLDGHSLQFASSDFGDDTREVLLDDGTFRRLVKLRKKPTKYEVKIQEKKNVNISLMNGVDDTNSKTLLTKPRTAKTETETGESDGFLDDFGWDTDGLENNEDGEGEVLYYYDPDLQDYIMQPKNTKHTAPSDRVFYRQSRAGTRDATREGSPTNILTNTNTGGVATDSIVPVTAGAIFTGLMPSSSSATVKLDEAHNTLKIQADRMKALPTALEKFMASTANSAALPPVNADGTLVDMSLDGTNTNTNPLHYEDDTYDDAVQLA